MNLYKIDIHNKKYKEKVKKIHNKAYLFKIYKFYN